jgi:hypothetical protein
MVVHRLVTDTAWLDEDGRGAIKQLCLRVASESIELHKIFTNMFGDWIKRFPGAQAVIDEYEVFRMYEDLPSSRPFTR